MGRALKEMERPESVEIGEEMRFRGPRPLATQLGNRKHHLHSLMQSLGWQIGISNMPVLSFSLAHAGSFLKVCSMVPRGPQDEV